MSSYSPINNLSVIDKIIEEVIRSQIDTYFNQNGLLLEGNHGGRSSHSTLTVHGCIQASSNRQMDQCKSSAILATDLSSAFNIVDTEIFLWMLAFYSFKEDATTLIKNYLRNRKSICRLQGYYSEEKNNKDCRTVQ